MLYTIRKQHDKGGGWETDQGDRFDYLRDAVTFQEARAGQALDWSWHATTVNIYLGAHAPSPDAANGATVSGGGPAPVDGEV